MNNDSFILLDDFEEIVKPIQEKSDDFHVNATIKFIDQKLYVTDWNIYKKFLPLSDYLLSSEPPVLSKGKGNSIQDLQAFANDLQTI